METLSTHEGLSKTQKEFFNIIAEKCHLRREYQIALEGHQRNLRDHDGSNHGALRRAVETVQQAINANEETIKELLKKNGIE